MRTGSLRPGQVHLFEPLGEARHADVFEAELLEHAHRDVELALAAVDQQQVRRVREPLARRARLRRARGGSCGTGG